MKDIGDGVYILSINIYMDRSRWIIRLRQITYLNKILKKFKMLDSKKSLVPMQHVWQPSKFGQRLATTNMSNINIVDVMYIIRLFFM